MLAISTECSELSIVVQRPLMSLRRSTLRVNSVSATATSLLGRAGRAIDSLINPYCQAPGANRGDSERRHYERGDQQEGADFHPPFVRRTISRVLHARHLSDPDRLLKRNAR